MSKPTFTATHILSDAVSANLQGQLRGIYCVCSAHPTVLEAAMRHAVRGGLPLVVESTSNQVNQQGGYTGMTPADFALWTDQLRQRLGLSPKKLLLGGDHLGPLPWKECSADKAMQNARELIRACVSAGYRKIHLDASIRLADDEPGPLPKELAAARSAALCHMAEETHQELSPDSPAPLYIIGTEVPPAGGAVSGVARPQVTLAQDAAQTLEINRRMFEAAGVGHAWSRVVGLVVQPGVEFGDGEIYEYDRGAASQLSSFIEAQDFMAFEAHSTDYQTTESLTAMVADHFAILKVGPALTFAYREALFSLAHIERELLGDDYTEKGSHLLAKIDQIMQSDPEHWQAHYQGNEAELRQARLYSLSDRIRYYWARPESTVLVNRLVSNLGSDSLPLTLISQFLPKQYQKVRDGAITPTTSDLIYGKIEDVLATYSASCYSTSE